MITSLVLATILATPVASPEVRGAWEAALEDGSRAVMIVTDGHLSIACYRSDPAEFISTRGGSWTVADGTTTVTWEYDTSDPQKTGSSEAVEVRQSGDQIFIDGIAWRRIDDGTPGDLEGAWLITGRKRDGEIRTSRPGVRRTMKILSGTRFQWIAYNVETREFSGTGGGTYTTDDGRYTEHIEFFSRDDSRVGASLPFSYEIVDGGWHHSGSSSKGDPLYEVWTLRSDLGI